MFPKGPSFNFFDILQPTGVSQSPKGPPFYNFWALDNSADFGCSRLVIASRRLIQ